MNRPLMVTSYPQSENASAMHSVYSRLQDWWFPNVRLYILQTQVMNPMVWWRKKTESAIAKNHRHVEGESIEGNLVSKMVVLPMGESAPGKARLEKAGLELRTEKKRVFVDMVKFDSLAQKAGIDFDWEILSLQIPTDRPAKQWMYFPALALLGLLVIRQRRRRI